MYFGKNHIFTNNGNGAVNICAGPNETLNIQGGSAGTFTDLTVTNLLDANLVDISGDIEITNTENAVSSTNGGTITTAGGAAIAKDLYVGGLQTTDIGASATTVNLGFISKSTIVSNILNWTNSTAGVTNVNWSSIAWSPSLGLFVAVSNGVNTMRSLDGINWINSTSGVTSASWSSITWSSSLGLFVAVSNGLNTMRSSDGINWTNSTSGVTSASWSSVVWSDSLGLFVAVSDGVNTMRSSNGVNWTNSTSGVTSATWLEVAWSPSLGLFVAVSHGVNTMRSSNGINWTNSTSGVIDTSWYSIAWGDSLGLFVATSLENTMSSSDGINWTGSTSGITSAFWTLVSWSQSLGLFVALSSGKTMRSSDGINWTSSVIGVTPRSWASVAWSPSLGLFVAVSNGINTIRSLDAGITNTMNVSNVLATTNVNGIINATVPIGSDSKTTGALILAGGIGISNTTDAINASNGGTITTAGGVAIAKKLFVGDATNTIGLVVSGTTPSTSTSSGSIRTPGGIGISNTTDAISSTNGGTFTTAGGAGVAKKLFVGGQITSTDTTISTSSTTGALKLAGGLAISNTTNSTNFTEGGSFTTAGGAAIAKSLYVGGNMSIAGEIGTTLGIYCGANLFVNNICDALTYYGSSIEPSTSPDTGGVQLLGSIGIQGTADAVNSTHGGTFTTAGGMAVGKKLFVGDKILVPNGSQSSPTYTFSSNTNTGMYTDGTRMHFTQGGVSQFFTDGTVVRFSGDISVDEIFARLIRVYAPFNTGTQTLMEFRLANNSLVGSITTNSTSTSYNTTSDRNLKEDIKLFEGGIDILKEIEIVDFKWKNADIRDIGVIAQQVKEVLPNAVNCIGDEKLHCVDYTKFVPYLIRSIQELSQTIEVMKNEINALKDLI